MGDHKLKIFQVITRLSVGGATAYTLALSESLQQRGHEVWLVSGRTEAGEVETSVEEKASLKQHRISSLQRSIHPMRDLLALWKLVRLLRAECPDIVHTHTAKAGFLGRIAALIARVPLKVHCIHGTSFKGEFYQGWKARLFTALERFAGKRCDGIFTPASSVRQELLDLGLCAADRVQVIPISVGFECYRDLTKFQGGLRKRLNLAPDTKIIGSVARLVPIKGIGYFLEAAKLVLEREQKVHFVIAGDGELRVPLEHKAKTLGLKEKVTFLGYCKDMREIYSDLDIVVLASLYEACPVAALEAMMARKPVIATAVGGVGDVICDGENGFLVPARDPFRLSQAILRLLHTPGLTKKAVHAAFELVSRKYTMENSVNRTCEWYMKWLDLPATTRNVYRPLEFKKPLPL